MICVDQKSGIRSSEPLQTLLAVRGSKVRYTCRWYEFEIEEIMREGRKKRVRVWTIMPYKADSLIIGYTFLFICLISPYMYIIHLLVYSSISPFIH